MSKNIIIQEGGTPYQFTAKKLKTDKGSNDVICLKDTVTCNLKYSQ